MPCKMCDEIVNPFPNYNGSTVEVFEWINNFILYIIMDILLIHAVIKVKPC